MSVGSVRFFSHRSAVAYWLTVKVFFGTLPKNVWQSHFAKVTTFIVFAILVLATAVPDIQVVMSLGGSLGGTFIAFMYFGQIWVAQGLQ